MASWLTRGRVRADPRSSRRWLRVGTEPPAVLRWQHVRMDVVATPAAQTGRVRLGVGWALFAASLLLAALAIGLTIADGRPLLAGDLPLGCELGISLTLLGAFVLSRAMRSPEPLIPLQLR